jgi:Tol biopolymer transport system component
MTRLVGGVLVLAAIGTLAGGPSVGRLESGGARSTPHGSLGVSARTGCSVKGKRGRDDLCVLRSVVIDGKRRRKPSRHDITISQTQHTLISLPAGRFSIFLGKDATCYAGVDSKGRSTHERTQFQTHTPPHALLSIEEGEAACTLRTGTGMLIDICANDKLYPIRPSADSCLQRRLAATGTAGRLTVRGSSGPHGAAGFFVSVRRTSLHGPFRSFPPGTITFQAIGGTVMLTFPSGKQRLLHANYREAIALPRTANGGLFPTSPKYHPIPYLIKVFNTQAPGITRGAAVPPAPAPLRRSSRKLIAFESNRKNHAYQIYVMNPDAPATPKQLTGPPHESFDPAWSPDGKQIVFESDRDTFGRSQLFLMDADGNNQTLLLKKVLDANERFPKWSPDGSKIAFEYSLNGRSEIYLVNPDGTGLRPLDVGPGQNSDPAWSPDGRRLAFTSDRDGKKHIWVVDVTGKGLRRLTKTSAPDRTPAWSPDGRLIVFERDPSSTSAKLFLMNADGTAQRRLTNIAEEEFHPAWSPDGTRIVFSESHGGASQIAIVNVDGGGFKPLTSGRNQNLVPEW